MKQKNLLRLSMVINGGNTKTFNTSLVKLVMMVLYDSEKFSLDINEIRNRIQSNYELEFTNQEIEKAINRKNYGINHETKTEEVSNGNYKSKEETITYSLDEKTLHKLKVNEEKNFFGEVIEDFIIKFEYTEINSIYIGNILHKYFYNIFNSNKETLMQLLRNQTTSSISKAEFTEINEKEKKIINDFLNWDNSKKNEYIFRTVSFCVDYCMLTIKKDHSSFSHLFKGKVFYLDSNIIFRMVGLNNEERKLVTNSFINKCIEHGIEIKYTNFTYKEIRDTVRSQVYTLREMLSGYKPVSIKNYRNFSKNANLYVIEMYNSWIKVNSRNHNDFMGFEKYIQNKIDSILDKYKIVEFMSYETTSKDKFLTLCKDLKEYKSSKGANYTNTSIKIDINNYMYASDLRKKSNGSSIVDISNYIISADANFCEWGKRILPSAIPISVLPSVWHSLLLKFKGRTNNDYAAFTLFLNLRHKVTNDDFDERRLELLSIVQGMNEPVSLKNLILEEISDNLVGKYSEEENIKEIVEKAKNEVIEREINRIYANDGKEFIDKGIAEGKLQTLYELAEKSATKIIDRRRGIGKIINYVKLTIGILLTVGFIFAIILFGVSIVSKTMKTIIFGYDLLNWAKVLGLLFTVFLYFVLTPVKKIYEKLDYEQLKERELKKLSSIIS